MTVVPAVDKGKQPQPEKPRDDVLVELSCDALIQLGVNR